MASIAEMLVL